MTDNGPGIRDAEKAKVVERFYRGDASRGTPGVGLGLSLAQAVARLHGSELELSDEHPGLRVVLLLPLCEPDAGSKSPTVSPAHPPSEVDRRRNHDFLTAFLVAAVAARTEMRAAVHRDIVRVGRVDAHLRLSGLRSQKNAADADEKSFKCHPASIHSSMAATNVRFRSVPIGSCRDSITMPCMLRTTYQRGCPVASSGSCELRRLTMPERYGLP